MTLPEWFQSISGMVSLVVYVLTWALIPHVLLQRKQPLATLAWVWSILLFPLIGPLVYLLIGTERIRRRTREGRLSVRNIVRPDRSDDLADFPASSQGAEWNDILRTLSLINRRTATIENSAEFLLDGGEFYPALEDAIRNARHHVHLEFYIWRKDETGRKFLQLLVDAAKRGVEVRLLLDEIGSMWTGRKFFQPLVEAGGKFSWFSTFAPRRGAFHINLRNHRKLVVADGLLAFAGGTNIGDEYISSFQGGPPHRDAQVRLQGPAVTQVARLFAEDWAYSAQETLKDEVYYPECPPMGDKIVQIVAGGPD
jgi:cardiolipin synthase